ncbi:MAG: hypothetical protein HY901_16820 [Deltaproteobacteria bacterium]|nr:hypothetical protein [Deltaproteobacteria bacterium]
MLGSPGVRGDWATEKLQVYKVLLASPGFDLATWVEPIVRALPFRLGDPTAEHGIPFAFDDDFNDLADLATDDLADLLHRRRESEGRAPASSHGEVELGSRGLRPATYSLGAFTDNAPGLPVAARAIRLDPALDCGLIEAWVSRGHGGPLFDRLVALFSRLRDEDLRAGSTAAYLALGLLGTLSHLESKKSRARGLVSRTFSPERLDKTLGSAWFALVETSLNRVLEGVSAPLVVQARALLCPLSFFSVRTRPLQLDVNPWGLSETMAAAADRLWLGMLEENPSPRDAEQRLAAAFLADPEVFQRAAQAGAVLWTRRRLFDWLAIHDGRDPEVSGALVPLVQSNEALSAALSDSKVLVTRVLRFAKGLKPDPAGEAATNALLDALRRGPEREDAVRDVAAAYAVLALDRVTADATDRGRARLRDRRGDYTREQLVADYLAGRLYRLSVDGKPIRRSGQRKRQGQLFLELRGLTQRKLKGGEGVSADFLRSELFEPLVAAASVRAEGLGGEQQLWLQSLLSDGAVFSGEIPALVELAREIPRVCRACAEKLRARGVGDPAEVELRRGEVEARVRAELDRLRGEATLLEREMAARRAVPTRQLEQTLFGALAQHIAELDARRQEAMLANLLPEARRAEEALQTLRAKEKELFSRVENTFGAARDQLVADLALAEDKGRLRELERRASEARSWAHGQLRALDEEAKLRGGDLEAGLFVAYGPHAQTTTLTDQRFGSVRVVIGEKIHEAARGTARQPLIKAKLDAQLGKARAARQSPRLELPFRIYVDSAYNLLFAQDLSELIDAAVREREPGKAREAAKAVAEAALRDLARCMGMGDGQAPESLTQLSDIYNVGEAFSGEALAAFLVQAAPGRTWFRKALAVEELDPEFQELFFFIRDSLDLIVSIPSDGDSDQALVFRRAGQAQFKGFEARAPTAVWELLRPDAPFTLLLAQKHLPLWTAEARGRPPGELPT